VIIDLLRHASTGRPGHLDGATDAALLAGAAEGLARHYHGRAWSQVFSSPRIRALDTARALAATPVRVVPGWRELDFGHWDGRPAREVPADALARFHADPVAHPLPGAEPWDAFAGRVGAALRELLATAADPGPPPLVVTHAGAMRMALHCTCGWGLAQTWALRLGYGARLRLRVEAAPDGSLWGEVLELEQP